MLRSLAIKNLALIDDATLEFDNGLTVLTGETGAGKSVIVTALTLALGGRAETEFIRHGADTAEISATFEDPATNDTLTVHREIAERGTTKLSVDGHNSTVTFLRELAEPMAQILGQHAGQMLMNEDNHLEFLDSFAGLTPHRSDIAERYRLWRDAAEELRRIRRRREQLAAERELLLFQKNEIEQAQIRSGEEKELENERRILDSARSLMQSASSITETVGGEEPNILQMLAAVRAELDRMADVDHTLEKQVESLTDIDFGLEEFRRFVEQYGSSLEDNPLRLEEINLRLDELYNLKKKYGGSEQSILATLEQIDEQLKNRPDTDSLIEHLEKDTDQRFRAYAEKAVALSNLRQKAAKKLRKLVIEELTDLAIDRADFECELLYEDDDHGVILDNRAVRPHSTGLEKARFLFTANPGEPLKSLVKTASGGEISRVLLALKSAELRQSGIKHSLLVFDEVDAGIGGRTAVEVGKKLKKLSASCQVLVITHLHQIARLADHHFVAEKSFQRGNRTIIRVARLDHSGIEAELDRMVALPKSKK